MGRYAQVDDASGIVVNVIEWNGDESLWQPPAGTTMVKDTANEAGPGFTYIDGKFVPPPGPDPEPEPEPEPAA